MACMLVAARAAPVADPEAFLDLGAIAIPAITGSALLDGLLLGKVAFLKAAILANLLSGGEEEAAYGAPDAYGAPVESYGAPDNSYGAPAASYEEPQHYHQETQHYEAPAQTYQEPAPQYQAAPQYEAAPAYEPVVETYGAPQAAPVDSYGSPAAPVDSYGSPQAPRYYN